MNNLFTQEDIDLIKEFGGKKQSDYPKAYNKLKTAYDKLGEIANKINKEHSNKYIAEIIRKPTNQGKYYERYHWMQVYPVAYYSAFRKKVYFVIGTDENGLNTHINSHERSGHVAKPGSEEEKIIEESYRYFKDLFYKSLDDLVEEAISLMDNMQPMLLTFSKRFGIELDATNTTTPIVGTNSSSNSRSKYTELLREAKNLILHGAPGTGKTYTANKIVEEMGAESVKVQFHPSYDYTDFVEGLRPIHTEDNQIGFDCKKGVFMEFCERALQNLNNSLLSEEDLEHKTAFTNAYEEFKREVSEANERNESVAIPLRTASMYMMAIGVSSQGNITLQTTDSESKYTVSFDRLMKLAEVFRSEKDLDKVVNIYKDITSIIGGSHSSGYWATLKYIYTKHYYTKSGEKSDSYQEKDYVIIIDEINRGDISKIFGELFSCIEASYRGVKGRVLTQYANLAEYPSLFDVHVKREMGSEQIGWFFVPENIYIIGTMNDIDRSVESMDFAMRRRFTFAEITAEESAETMNITGDKLYRMRRLNEAIISDEIGLDPSFQIGGSYFLDELTAEELWGRKLKGLLKEYLRGMDDIEEKLTLLKHAYDGTKVQG